MFQWVRLPLIWHPCLNTPNLCWAQAVSHLQGSPSCYTLREAEASVDLLGALLPVNQVKAEVRALPEAAH